MFQIRVRPPKQQSIGYWLNQVSRPIKKVLFDDGAQKIVKDKFGIEIGIGANPEASAPARFNKLWQEIEDRALSQNRKVILVIDDEFRKLEDVFFPLMDHFHIIPAFHAKDALAKLTAAKADLAIVDMQIGSGGIWSENETQDFKATGFKLCQVIGQDFPSTKIGILTGTKHRLPPIEDIPLAFYLTKPVNPKFLLKKVLNVLA